MGSPPTLSFLKYLAVALFLLVCSTNAAKKAISCGKPSLTRHGNFTGTDFTYRSSVSYKCDFGYKLSGKPYRRCRASGKWSKKPTCKKYKCRIGRKLSIQDGTVTMPDKPYFHGDTMVFHGATIIFQCKQGYELEGADTITCVEGQWNSYRLPYCKVIACPDPGFPENGHRVGRNFRIGGTVRFGCHSGLKLIGSRIRTCLENKLWSGSLPVCDNGNTHCPMIGEPISGFKIGNRYNSGSIVRFRCKQGYILQGSSLRYCTTNRTWNGTEAQCIGEFEYMVKGVNETAFNLRKSIDTMLEYTCSGGNSTCNTTGLDARARAINLGKSGGLDVLFIFDASSSINKKDFRRGIKFAEELITVLGPTWKPKGTKIATIIYATEAELVFNFGDDGANSVKGVISKLKAMEKYRRSHGRKIRGLPKRLRKNEIIQGGTASAIALEKAAQIVFVNKNSKRQRFCFFITDGKSNIGGPPEKAATELKEDYKVEVYAIGVGKEVNSKELYKIATNEEDHVIVVKKFKDLSDSVKQAVKMPPIDYSPCGESNYDTRGRMVGGNKVSRGTWPWQVGIYLLSQDADGALAGKIDLFCGGALIRPGWILTAAHCFVGNPQAASLIIRAGDNERLTESDFNDKLERSGREFFVHENFNTKTYENDVALIKLKRPFKLAPHVRLVCLPEKNEPDPATSGKVGIVAGWGITKAFTGEQLLQQQFKTIAQISKLMSKVLLQSAYEIQPNERCNASTSYLFDPDVSFCAGDGKGGNDTCKGDSGGSFVVQNESPHRWVSTGLVSWGVGCAQKSNYGFYTRVAHFVDWIEKTMKDNQ